MRTKALNIIVNLLFLLLILGLWYTQIMKAPKYIRLSRNNRIRVVHIAAPRGDIFDRKGDLLVSSRMCFNCVAIPQELADKENTFSKLSGILGIDRATLKKNYKKEFLNAFAPVIIAKNISREKVIAVEEERLNMPGVFITTTPVRDYIYKSVYTHLIGYIGKIGESELDKLDSYGYRMSDYIGKDGIEKEYDNYLKGTDGGMQVEVDNMGRQVRVLGIKKPEKGKDLYLTLDLELQKYVDSLFEGKKGACVIIDPRNGEVLSLVSRPNFDSNLFINPSPDKIKSILKDSKFPMLNRAIHCAYPPGSSFKIVTASAALDEHKINQSTTFVCTGAQNIGGKVFHCWREGGHGPQNVITGIKNSCNVFFYNTGILAGPDHLGKYAQRFGFGRPSGIDLPGEVSGIVPSSLWKKLTMGAKWYGGETANYAIGQGYLLVTPIQILNMMSAIANKGIVARPHIVGRIGDVDTSITMLRDTGVSGNTIAIITQGVRKVVEDSDGTGMLANVKGISIAGKTGTAQTGRGTTHAWFTGFAPVENPRISLVVFLEEGGRGGASAAYIGGRVFEKAKELDLL